MGGGDTGSTGSCEAVTAENVGRSGTWLVAPLPANKELGTPDNGAAGQKDGLQPFDFRLSNVVGCRLQPLAIAVAIGRPASKPDRRVKRHPELTP